jgi:hypothetical protein
METKTSHMHQYPLLGYIFIGSLIALFLVILIKVLISDAINWNKRLKKSVNELELYPNRQGKKYFAKI